MSRRLRSEVVDTYWVLVTVKNGERTITQSLESVFGQSTKPNLICVVDDGSTDTTLSILAHLQNIHPQLHIIRLPDRGYDSRRIVHNWNTACEYARNTGAYDFLLISSDDVIFPAEYVERLMREMATDPNLVVASGNRGLQQSDYMSLPEGAGRLIRASFFQRLGYQHPPYYGYEPWLLYKAMQMGYGVKKLSDLTYKHERTFGVGHKFVEYGPAMRCLGYHPLFVFARVARNFVTGKAGISKRASLRMLRDYLFDSKWKDDPYYHLFEPELRTFVRDIQKKRLLNRIS